MTVSHFIKICQVFYTNLSTGVSLILGHGVKASDSLVTNYEDETAASAVFSIINCTFHNLVMNRQYNAFSDPQKHKQWFEDMK